MNMTHVIPIHAAQPVTSRTPRPASPTGLPRHGDGPEHGGRVAGLP